MQSLDSKNKKVCLPAVSLAAAMLSTLPLTAFANTESPGKSKPEELEAVKVYAEKDKDSYRARQTRSSKENRDPHEIPQAITTVTHALIEEQQVGSLREALRNVSGLTFNAAEGGRSGDNMMLRGFYTFGDIYLDGIRDTAQYNRETFYLEQVDVLRGAAAMLFGRGQAGGVINQVSKMPLKENESEINVVGGTDDYMQFKGDFNLRIGEDDGLRINLMDRDESNQRFNPANGAKPELHRRGAHMAYTANIGEKNEFSAAHLITQTRDLPDYGFSFNPNTRRINTNFPVDFFWGTPNNFDDSNNVLSTLSYVHRFNSQTEWRTQIRKADYERDYWVKTPSAILAPSAIGGTGGNVTRSSDYATLTLQTDFNHHFQVAGMTHDLLIGGEWLQEVGYRRALLNLGTTAAPLYLPGVENSAVAPSTFDGISKALYMQDTIEFVPDWRLLVGARYDQLAARYSSLTSPQLRFGEWSTRAGISWQPSALSHYYLTHSDSFSPTADLYQLSGAAYPAERSNALELGAKWLLLGDQLALRAALYRAEKEWERNTDLESTAAILTKKRRTDGFELELVGRLTKKWQVFSGLSLMNAKIVEVAENRNATTGALTLADSRLKGQQARNTPDYTFNLWTTYAFAENWKAGIGIESKGRRLVYSPSSANVSALFVNGKFDPNTAPAYTRWDAMLSYETKDWEARLNLRNLTDKVYFDALYDNGGFAVPGNGRSATFSIEYKF